MATVERIRVHPVKSLDAVERERASLTETGGLDGDRAYAVRDDEGAYVNGKRTDAVHRLRTEFDLEEPSVTIGVRGSGTARTFHLERERDALADWLSEYYGLAVTVEAAPGGALTDSRVLGGDVAGATVVSTATLETVASWFPDVDVESVRRRFRANLEVAGVEPFWEDRLVGDGRPGVRVGDVTFRGVKPISRCVVPTRDPDTGEETPGFRERFIERREATFPPWADPDAFDHFYALTALVHPASGGDSIAVGDPVELVE